MQDLFRENALGDVYERVKATPFEEVAIGVGWCRDGEEWEGRE